MNKFWQGSFHIYVQQVMTEAKPVAQFGADNMEEIEYAKNYIKKYYNGKIKLYISGKSIWIYKHNYLLEVIKNLPEQPKTIFEHWILGKAFGYSDEAIEEFLSSSKRSSVASGARSQCV